MSGATQQELEVSILLMLAEEARVSNRRLSARQVAGKFVPPVGEMQVQISLNHLTKIGLVSSNFDNVNSSGFQITRDGILRVESGFNRIDNESNSTYIPSQESSVWDQGQLDALAEQGTYVFPVPSESSSLSTDNGPAPVIIHNHVNPTFNNTHTSSNSGDNSSGAAWFGAWGTWAAVVVAAVAILVTLRLAGKI